MILERKKQKHFFCFFTQLWLLTAFFIAFIPSQGFSQSYSVGYTKYVQGDFGGAEDALTKALSTVDSSAEKSRIYKILGISQYMQGKRREAIESFKNAKTLSPNMKILASEVLDETVIAFFDSVKGATAPPPKKAVKPEPKKPEPTFIGVLSPIKNAEVLINGKPAGKVNELIPTEGGIVEITVRAPGFKDHTQPVNVKKGFKNQINVILSELPKKEEKQPADTKSTAAKPERSEPRKGGKAPTSKDDDKTKAASSGWTFHAGYLLPFGVGQFMQGKSLTGTFFLVTELGAAGFSAYQYYAHVSYVDGTDVIVNQKNDEINNEPDQNRKIEIAIEGDKIRAERVKESDRLYELSVVGGWIFGALWFVGVLDALIFQPTGEHTAQHFRLYEKSLDEQQITDLYSLKNASYSHHYFLRPQFGFDPDGEPAIVMKLQYHF